MENLSNTKLQILRSCIKAKSWTEIIEITGKSKPTVKSHIDRLKDESLLEKIETGYQTTAKGIEQLCLKPHRKSYASPDKLASEVYQMVNDNIFPGLNITERIQGFFAVGILKNIGGIKKIRLFLDDISKAIRDSVVVWLPHDLEFDNNAFKVVNQLISKQINVVTKFEDKGKLQIVIDFDLPLALDNIIKEETDPEIKIKLIDHRDEILKTLYTNWSKLTK